jgi:uncharacterized membrane protein
MTESLHETSHKDKFQLERIAFFSDAVFAIAITLLVIEIHVPEIPEGKVTDEALFNALLILIPKFIGFFVSFFVIGMYWMSHHRLFRYLVGYNAGLLWTNVWFLLTIVLMPFSSAFLSDYYSGALRVPLGFYMVNISLSGWFSYRLWKLAGNPAHHLSTGLEPAILKYNITRALTMPVFFMTLFLLSFIWTQIYYFILPFTPLVSWGIRRHFMRKYPELMRVHA